MGLRASLLVWSPSSANSAATPIHDSWQLSKYVCSNSGGLSLCCEVYSTGVESNGVAFTRKGPAVLRLDIFFLHAVSVIIELWRFWSSTNHCCCSTVRVFWSTAATCCWEFERWESQPRTCWLYVKSWSTVTVIINMRSSWSTEKHVAFQSYFIDKAASVSWGAGNCMVLWQVNLLARTVLCAVIPWKGITWFILRSKRKKEDSYHG